MENIISFVANGRRDEFAAVFSNHRSCTRLVPVLCLDIQVFFTLSFLKILLTWFDKGVWLYFNNYWVCLYSCIEPATCLQCTFPVFILMSSQQLYGMSTTAWNVDIHSSGTPRTVIFNLADVHWFTYSERLEFSKGGRHGAPRNTECLALKTIHAIKCGPLTTVVIKGN